MSSSMSGMGSGMNTSATNSMARMMNSVRKRRRARKRSTGAKNRVMILMVDTFVLPTNAGRDSWRCPKPALLPLNGGRGFGRDVVDHGGNFRAFGDEAYG